MKSGLDYFANLSAVVNRESLRLIITSTLLELIILRIFIADLYSSLAFNLK